MEACPLSSSYCRPHSHLHLFRNVTERVSMAEF
jgi:hypothetical protein